MGQLGVTPPPPSAAQERLESWKEIAAYLKKSVRTVQDWEKKEGLPVHRRLHDKLGTVYAYRAELDAWWQNGHARLEKEEELPPEAQETGLVRQAVRVWGLTPRQWWKLDTLAELLVCYPLITLLIYLAWKAKEWYASAVGGVIFPAFGLVLTAVSLRVFLLTTAAFHPAELPRQVRRLAPWLTFTHLAILFLFLPMATENRAADPGLAALLLSLALAGAVVVLIIDPAINRAAFPEIAATETAPPGLTEYRRMAWIQSVYLVPFGVFMLLVPGSIQQVLTGERARLVLPIPALLEPALEADNALLAAMMGFWVVVLAFGILMGKTLLAMWEGNFESVGRFYRRFGLFFLADLLAVALLVDLLVGMRLPPPGFILLVLPVLLYLPFYQRQLARKLRQPRHAALTSPNK